MTIRRIILENDTGNNDDRGDRRAGLTRSCKTSWRHSTGRWRFESIWGSAGTPGCCHLGSQKAFLQAVLTLVFTTAVYFWGPCPPHTHCPRILAAAWLFLWATSVPQPWALRLELPLTNLERNKPPASEWLREEHVTQICPMRAGPGTLAPPTGKEALAFCQGCWAVTMEAQFSKAGVGKPWLVHRPKLASATYFCIADEWRNFFF